MTPFDIAPPPAAIPECADSDPTFRRLLGEAAWRRLAPAVRERFRWKPGPNGIVYRGVMHQVRCSAMGWLFAQACRAIGAPLAPHRGRDIAVSVVLTAYGDGVLWERFYAFPGRATVRCASVKRASPTEGLVECVGRGVGMWLAVTEEDGALHFRSTGYFWRVGARTLRLPAWLAPGALHVVHADLGGGRFRFAISVRHTLFGTTFEQDGVFTSAEDGDERSPDSGRHSRGDGRLRHALSP